MSPLRLLWSAVSGRIRVMTNPLFDLSGKAAVVTGGTRGIGLMIA